MSVVRTVAGVTATAVKAASGVTAAGVRVAGGVAATAVKGAAVATTYATTKGDTESTQDPSAALRYTVKAAKGATKVALAATRTTANVAESAIGAVGTVAGKYAPIPSAIRDSDLALGLMEVAGAAVSGAASVVDATASASLRVTTATADAAGTVVGHKYGDKTGELVKDTLHIAVDIGETVGHIGKTQVVNLAPKVAQQFVAASVAANTPAPPASEPVAVKETSSGGVLATAGTVVSTAASTVSTIGTGVSVVGSTVVTGAKITATTVGAVGKGVMYTGAAVGSAATLVGGLASKMTSWATKKPTPAVDADKPQGGDAAPLTTEEAQPPKP